MTGKLALNDKLLNEALRLGGHRTKKATITEALREYIQRRRQLHAIELFGKSVSSLLSLLLTTFSAMYVKIIWSPLFQALHTWTLVILSKFPRRIAIGSSGNRFLYVMRSDSGYFLWRHKRYRRSELVSSMPIRGSGMLFTGSGTALAAALDFCKYAVQA